MNESRDRCGCGHSIASHDNWGTGPCAARDCGCAKFGAPARANDLEPLGGPVPGVNGSHLPEEQG